MMSADRPRTMQSSRQPRGLGPQGKGSVGWLAASNPCISHVSEGDIETLSGQRLTLMNPAYALRQINQEFADLYGAAGHIFSLNPPRPSRMQYPILGIGSGNHRQR